MSRLQIVTPGDYGALGSFLANFAAETRGVPFWLDRFASWWDKNPALQDNCPRGWVLRDGDRIVGFMGCIPACFQLNGVETIVYSGTTWRVETDYRSESLKLFFRLLEVARDTVLFNTSAIPDVATMQSRMGFREMPWGGHRRSVYLVASVSVIRERLSRWLRVLTWPAAGVIKAVQAWRTQGLRQTRFSTKQLDWADESFDELWERMKARYANTSVRRSETVNWYCFSAAREAKILVGCYDGDRLAGYAVCRRYQKGPLIVLGCLDMWCDLEIDGTVGALVGAIVLKAAESGFDLVQIPNFDEEIGIRLRATGLFQMDVESTLGQFKMGAESLKRLGRETSYLTRVDGDHGL